MNYRINFAFFKCNRIRTFKKSPFSNTLSFEYSKLVSIRNHTNIREPDYSIWTIQLPAVVTQVNIFSFIDKSGSRSPPREEWKGWITWERLERHTLILVKTTALSGSDLTNIAQKIPKDLENSKPILLISRYTGEQAFPHFVLLVCLDIC